MNPILHSKIIGTGKSVCILHGFLGMSDNWKTLGSSLAEHNLEVHLIDQRNHGRSFHSEDFNYDVLAHDLKEYLEDKNIEETMIIGHSMGGKTAMQFACNYPEKTSKLLVADIAPKFYPPHHHDIINGLNKVNVQELKSRAEADSELQKHIADFGIRQFLLKNLYRDQEKKLSFRFNLPVLSHKMEEVGENINSTDHYPGPTLFLKGSKSEYVSDNDMIQIKSHFPNATMNTISNAGHWLHAENPREFLSKALLFLNE